MRPYFWFWLFSVAIYIPLKYSLIWLTCRFAPGEHTKIDISLEWNNFCRKRSGSEQRRVMITSHVACENDTMAYGKNCLALILLNLARHISRTLLVCSLAVCTKRGEQAPSCGSLKCWMKAWGAFKGPAHACPNIYKELDVDTHGCTLCLWIST